MYHHLLLVVLIASQMHAIYSFPYFFLFLDDNSILSRVRILTKGFTFLEIGFLIRWFPSTYLDSPLVLSAVHEPAESKADL